MRHQQCEPRYDQQSREPHYHSLMYVETFLSVMMLVDINLTLIVCIYYSQGRLDRDISRGGRGGREGGREYKKRGMMLCVEGLD